MKDYKPFEKDEALSKLLRTWKVDAQLPPRFQEAVWRGIERADSVAKISFWRVLVGRVERAFAQRSVAAAYIFIFLLVGVGAGYWRAGDKTAQVESEWRTRYVQAVDPYQMPR